MVGANLHRCYLKALVVLHVDGSWSQKAYLQYHVVEHGAVGLHREVKQDCKALDGLCV
jgi:hypothetical protein